MHYGRQNRVSSRRTETLPCAALTGAPRTGKSAGTTRTDPAFVVQEDTHRIMWISIGDLQLGPCAIKGASRGNPLPLPEMEVSDRDAPA